MANKKVKTLTVDGATYDIKDANAVHKTGNETETITGSKTFTYDTTFTKSAPQIIMKDINASADVKNQSLTDAHNGPLISFRDKNGKNSGYVYTRYEKNGDVKLVLQANRLKSDDTGVSASLSVILDKNGNASTYAVTPPTTSATNGTYIATTGWANTAGVDSAGNNVNNIVHKTGTETIGGTKTFSDGTVYLTNSSQSTRMLLRNTSTDGQVAIVNETTDGGSWKSTIYLNYDKNKDTSSISLSATTATAPAPATTSNDASIATTKWVNDKFQVVSSLPSSPDANTFYFVKG